MTYDRNDRRYGRDQSYGYRPTGGERDYERGYDRGEDLSYNRDRGYGPGDRGRGRVDYGRSPQGYDYEDRGFFERAGDEVRSWFGDEEAERRRRYDERYAQREYDREQSRYGQGGSARPFAYGNGATGYEPAGFGWDQAGQAQQRGGGSGRGGHDHDPGYRSWRDRQIEALDRDYDDYRREHQSKFDSEFGGWRGKRQGQRDSLSQVKEHQEVVGSDGQHVGKVDHVRDDRVLLAKNDQDAGGHHHSIPSSWIETVGEKVQINRTAADAKRAWRDEEAARQAQGSSGQNRSPDDRGGQRNLNRSFPGTY